MIDKIGGCGGGGDGRGWRPKMQNNDIHRQTEDRTGLMYIHTSCTADESDFFRLTFRGKMRLHVPGFFHFGFPFYFFFFVKKFTTLTAEKCKKEKTRPGKEGTLVDFFPLRKRIKLKLRMNLFFKTNAKKL